MEAKVEVGVEAKVRAGARARATVRAAAIPASAVKSRLTRCTTASMMAKRCVGSRNDIMPKSR